MCVSSLGTCMTSKAARSVPTVSFPSFNLTAETLLNEMEMCIQCTALRCAVPRPSRVIFVTCYQDISECNYTNNIEMSAKKSEKSPLMHFICFHHPNIVVVFCNRVLCSAMGRANRLVWRVWEGGASAHLHVRLAELSD